MIFNHSATSAQLVHVNSVTDSEQNLSTNMDYDKPFVISGLKQLQECFKQDTTFEAEVLAFTTQFTGSSLQATAGLGNFALQMQASRARSMTCSLRFWVLSGIPS